MSYRKITVDEKSYEYVIGRTHLKIKGFGLFEVAKIGNRIAGSDKFVVSPGTVAKVIKGEPLPTPYHCKEHNYTTDELTHRTIQDEVKGRRMHVPNCPECVANFTSTL